MSRDSGSWKILLTISIFRSSVGKFIEEIWIQLLQEIFDPLPVLKLLKLSIIIDTLWYFPYFLLSMLAGAYKFGFSNTNLIFSKLGVEWVLVWLPESIELFDFYFYRSSLLNFVILIVLSEFSYFISLKIWSTKVGSVASLHINL